MGLIEESLILFKREMLIFKANLRTNLLRSIIFPLVIILFFGNIGTAFKNTPIAVVNYANNAQSYGFINTLQTDQVLQITALTNEQDALNMLGAGRVQMVVIILPNFPSQNKNVPSIQVYYSNTQLTVINAVLPLITTYAQKFGPVSVNQSQVPQKPSSIVTSNALYSTKGNYIDFLTGGVIAMVVVFGALFGGGISFISDRQLGYIKAMLITPINKNAIVLGRIFSGAMQSIIFSFLALGIGLLFGVTIAMGPIAILYILVVTIVLGIGFSGISMIVASKVKKVDAYAIFSQAVGLPLWFISGGIIPASSLPSWLAPLSIIDPLTYSNNIVRAVIMQGFISINQFVMDLSILVIFALVMIALAFKTFKSTID